MDGRNRGMMLWAAVVAAIAIVAVLAVVLTQPGSDGTGPMTTPTTTATATVDGTVTATAGGTAWATGTPAATGTGGATATAGATATCGATGTPGATATGGMTSTPGPTATFTGEGYHIYFTGTDYQVSGEGQEFYTTINITPIELFYGAQFALVWDCTLFEMRTGWTQSKGVARLYNGTSPNPGWTDGVVALNPTGDNPQCPDPKQGQVKLVVLWSGYIGIVRDGEGVNVTEDGTLLTVGWRTHSGGDFRSGDTDIRFAPEMEICGYLDGGYQYTKPVYWHNTSVAVE